MCLEGVLEGRSPSNITDSPSHNMEMYSLHEGDKEGGLPNKNLKRVR